MCGAGSFPALVCAGTETAGARVLSVPSGGVGTLPTAGRRSQGLYPLKWSRAPRLAETAADIARRRSDGRGT